MNYKVLILIAILLLLIFMYSSSTSSNIVFINQKQNDKLSIKQAINTWTTKLTTDTKINITLDRQYNDNDIYIAKSNITYFTFDSIDATITLYPVFDSLTTKEKTTTLIHEMGHVLGFGTKWNNQEKLYKNEYPLTIQEFNSKFNKNVDFIKVKNGHWDEPELMDDIMSPCGCDDKKISSITLANLRDIGWKF